MFVSACLSPASPPPTYIFPERRLPDDIWLIQFSVNAIYYQQRCKQRTSYKKSITLPLARPGKQIIVV